MSSQPTENKAASTSQNTPSSQEKTKDDPFSTISLRPGGGFGFGSFGKKPTTSTPATTSPTSTRDENVKQQTTPSSSQSQQFRPGWKDNQQNKGGFSRDSTSSSQSSGSFTKSFQNTQEDKNELTGGEPFVSETILEMQIYDRSFMKKIQQSCSDIPADLQTAFFDFPDIQRTTYSPTPTTRSDWQDDGESRRSSGGQRTTSSSKYSKAQNQTSQQTPTQGQGQSKESRPSQSQRPSHNNPPSKQTAQNLARRAENPWAPRPSFLKDEKDQVLRDIKGILNKITPEKFQKLTVKIANLFAQVTDEQIYAEAVSLVFAKAVSEPAFSHMYAELCVKLNELKSQLPDEKLSFRKVLLTRCQEEFERTSRKVEDLPEDPEERMIVRDKDRKNKLGNVKFIGELFKNKLLSPKIIHGCIKILFNTIYKYKDDKETLEMNSILLCKLMTTIGKLIDTEEAKPYIDTYFQHINKFCDSSEYAPRIRFAFQEVRELRANNWNPRREHEGPKKISEVRADAHKKDLEEEAFIYQTIESQNRERAASGSSSLIEGRDRSASASSGGSSSSSKVSEEAKKKKNKKKKKPADKRHSGENNEDNLEGEMLTIVKDFLEIEDLKETEKVLKETLHPNAPSKFVEVAITYTLEKNERDREMTSKLFADLTHNRVLSQDHFVKAFKTLLENLKDLEVDIPFASRLIGKFIGNAVVSKCISQSWFEGIDEKVRSSMMEVIGNKK